jgi:hypothetical protein
MAGMPAEMSLTVVGRVAVRDELSRSAERDGMLGSRAVQFLFRVHEPVSSWS